MREQHLASRAVASVPTGDKRFLVAFRQPGKERQGFDSGG